MSITNVSSVMVRAKILANSRLKSCCAIRDKVTDAILYNVPKGQKYHKNFSILSSNPFSSGFRILFRTKTYPLLNLNGRSLIGHNQ